MVFSIEGIQFHTSFFLLRKTMPLSRTGALTKIIEYSVPFIQALTFISLLQVDPDKVFVVPNGVDSNICPPPARRLELESRINGWRAAGVELVRRAKAEGLPIIAIDNVPGCQQIETYELPENCVLLFGQEGPGLSEAAIAASEAVLEITQFGSTRSINASAAAAITMHAWIMRHVFKK